jgi:hypothetical protein
MNATDMISRVTNKITESFDSINPWLGLSSTDLNRRPDSGWNLLEILEHIYLTNHYLMILIEKGRKKALKINEVETITGQDYEDHFSKVEEIGIHQLFFWHRPEHMEPKGDKNVEEISKLLSEQQNRCLEILNDLRNGEGLNYRTTMTVHNLGKLDVYQYLYFLARHIDRHVVQMQKIISSRKNENLK